MTTRIARGLASLERAEQWVTRFEAVGYSAAAAWQAAMDRQAREALEDSLVEHLPPWLRAAGIGLLVDVGANNGHWLECLMRFVAVKRVEACEPNPTTSAAFSARFAGRQDTIRLHPVAIGRETSAATLYATQNASFASLLAPDAALLSSAYDPAHVAVEQQLAVPVRRLDDVLADCAETRALPIDLLKIDVQGYEAEVLAGATETLARTRVLVIEANYTAHYQDAPTFEAIWPTISRAGFALYTMSDPWRSQADSRALWADAVFIRS